MPTQNEWTNPRTRMTTMKTMTSDESRFALVLLMLFVLSSPLIAQDSGKQDSGKKKKKEKGAIEFEFKHRPSLRIGKLLRVDVRTKVQTDFRSFSPEVPT